MIKYRKGDLIQLAIDGKFDVIAHGCNCHHTMGGGIAKQIKEVFPEAFDADKETVFGYQDKLGTMSVAEIYRFDKPITVCNLYTQFKYGIASGPHVDYDAIRSCMKLLNKRFEGKIGIPKIGAGLAGGDWNIIEQIINEEFGDRKITVVEYLEKK